MEYLQLSGWSGVDAPTDFTAGADISESVASVGPYI
jgi:hypothetical protein